MMDKKKGEVKQEEQKRTVFKDLPLNTHSSYAISIMYV